ncbi:gram-negative bacteria-binding protein 2-like [Drosophila sulfurigaster albostrigata]|uniref:gram-negative bacteria-binding protein 2-like n=1 Tax=Drosophila sulfurigaster albostrigata TaxID=89887 RepID=UPI002D21C9BB|nr:gram-negative bacteria-binding protein 2-like [Drosophila sulfurigaster albostrigata]
MYIRRIKMNYTALCLAVLYLGCLVAAFDVEKAEISVGIVETVVTITLPENPDVKSAFFSTGLTDECAAGYIFLQSINENKTMGYKHDLKQKLNSNDLLRISAVFETQDQVMSHTFNFQIDSNGQGVKQNTSVASNPFCSSIKPIVWKYPRGCIPSEWHFDNPKQCSNKIIFEEKFNDDKLRNWNISSYSNQLTVYSEYTAYVPENVFVKERQLHLKATTLPMGKSFHLKKCTANKNNNATCGPRRFGFGTITPPFYTAQIQSINQKLKYGRYEICAKVAKGEFLFSYIMLHPIERHISDDPAKHIRLMYVRGSSQLWSNDLSDMAGSTVFGGAMFMPFSGELHEVKEGMSLKTTGAHYGDEFHNYTMIWHKDRIIFKVDGTTYGKINDKKVLRQLDDPAYYYLVLGLTAGGLHNFPDHEIKHGSIPKFNPPGAEKSAVDYVQDNPWTQPKLIIDSIRVFTTHADEE